MPLFGRRHAASQRNTTAGVAGLAEVAIAQGWQPVSGNPFDGRFGDVVHDTTRAMYGVPRGMTRASGIGQTYYSDAFRGSISGRMVIVANAWTAIEPGLFQAATGTPAVAVCVAEIPSMLALSCVQPRQFPDMMRWPETPTGNPAFDEYFRVTASPGGISQMLTPDMQQRIMAHGDWVVWTEGYLFGCISKGAFDSANEVSRRISELLGIVAAIPESLLPRQVDHAVDDLVARINQLNGIEDAMAMLQHLTPTDRERLARSATPMAAFADVRTPQEAMARFQVLDPQQKMQLLAMFGRVNDAQRGS